MHLRDTLGGFGITAKEMHILLRAEKTLNRWSTEECNGTIQRDGENGDGKPFRYYETANGEHKKSRAPIPDREAGALKRCKSISEQHGLIFYHQGDPRGCQVYLLRKTDVPKGCDAGAYYSRGIAVCI